MYHVNSREFNYQYQRSKLKVKLWEDKFKTENGRIPTKADIKTSSPKVRYYYKIYWNLKTQLMEETILGTEKSKENTINRFKSDGVLKEHTNILDDKSPLKNKSSSDIISKKMKENDSSLDVQGSKNELKKWGVHLNKVKSSPLQSEILSPLNCTVSEKLFKGSKFKKRNPRKSLKENKSNTSLSGAGGTSKPAPLKAVDYNVLSVSLDTFSSTDSFPSNLSPCPNTQNVSPVTEPCSVENDCSQKIKDLIMSKAELSPFFKSGKCKIITDAKTVQNHSIGLVHTMTAESKKDFQPSRIIDVGWIERCNEGAKGEKISCDSGFESTESSAIVSPDNKETIKADGSDDDDIIADSDNEMNDCSRLSFLPVKRKVEDISSESLPSESGTAKSPSPQQAEEVIEQPLKKVKLDPYKFSENALEKKSVKNVKQARLEKKMKLGTLNENYVKINIKKKIYCRGKKNFVYSNYKKRNWKKRKENLDRDGENSGIMTCYKCGEAGHYARYCQKPAEKILSREEDEEEEEEESTLPTLEEAEAMAREKANPQKKYVLEIQAEPKEMYTCVDPLYELKEDGTLRETPQEVFDALKKFGHSCFRPGQEKTIMRILSGISTLVTISTGGGKSLCYQLPAYLYAIHSNSLALVVSPLVSLMEDQVSGSSSFFKLGCLHTNQTSKQRQTVIDDAKNGKLYALLVSPEAIVTGDNSSGLWTILKSLPPISFACIDEVHCVSQWSHNFRPSYLMLTKVMKERLGVKTILGLTATATKTTVVSITKELGITDPNGVIKDNPLPSNLCLSISQEKNKDKALLELLESPRFKDANAILIYCTRRDECERLAALIRTVHNDPNSLPATSKRLSLNAEQYHAGLSSARRKQVQKAFMKGNLRVVVATIAFGMGINKQDIRGVIHYNMPKDFESYVQEVGRAGRDGMLAHCHLFLDENGKDLNELRRHIYMNAVDRHVLRKLLQRVFVECKCKETGKSCPGHEIAFDCNETVQALDMPEENIYTLLCYLELHPKKLVRVLTPGFINCKIQSYRGVKAITTASKKCPPLAVACAMNPNAFHNGNSLVLNVINLANAISWNSGTVKNQLKNAEWCQGKDDKWKKTGIVVEFYGLGFRILSKGDMTPQELDEALNYLIQRVENQEKRSLDQLEIIFSALSHFTSKKDVYLADYDKEKSDGLKDVIRKYFDTEELSSEIPVKKLEVEDFDEEEVASDVRALICNYRDVSFNGRTVARIFHGIQSPNYPSSIWYSCPHWRQHIDKDFNKICRTATREILRFK